MKRTGQISFHCPCTYIYCILNNFWKYEIFNFENLNFQIQLFIHICIYILPKILRGWGCTTII